MKTDFFRATMELSIAVGQARRAFRARQGLVAGVEYERANRLGEILGTRQPNGSSEIVRAATVLNDLQELVREVQPTYAAQRQSLMECDVSAPREPDPDPSTATAPPFHVPGL